MSPLTAAEAVSAGLITGARWRHDAMNFITHFPMPSSHPSCSACFWDPSTWQAACDNGVVGDIAAEAQAHEEAVGQPHIGMRADGASLLEGSFHPWGCWVHHFCGNAGVTQSEHPYFLRISDYIANMQRALDAEESVHSIAKTNILGTNQEKSTG